MLLIGLTITYTHLGEYILATFRENTQTLIKLTFYISGTILSFLGILFYLNIAKKAYEKLS